MSPGTVLERSFADGFEVTDTAGRECDISAYNVII